MLETLLAYVAFVAAAVDAQLLRIETELGLRPGRLSDRGQVQTLVAVVTIGIIIIIGILIYDQVQDSTTLSGASETDFTNNTVLENASVNSTDDFGSAMELAPVILIILIASVVIGIVSRFQS